MAQVSPFVYRCHGGCKTDAVLRRIPAVMENLRGHPVITNINENRVSMALSALAKSGWKMAFNKRRLAPTAAQLKSDPNSPGTLLREQGRFCPRCLAERLKQGWKVPAGQAL